MLVLVLLFLVSGLLYVGRPLAPNGAPDIDLHKLSLATQAAGFLEAPRTAAAKGI